MTDQEERKVIVDRSKWRFGGHGLNYKYGPTNLLNKRGFKCCLGFAVEQLEGVTERELLGLSDPASLIQLMKGLTVQTTLGHIENSGLSNRLISINDREDLTPPEREEKIYEAGKEGGIIFEFVGEYPAAE
jgi:hypothetical protein